MNKLTLALLLSGTSANSTIFTNTQKKTFCIIAKYFDEPLSGRSSCSPTTSKGHDAGTAVDVTKKNARSYSTACARECVLDDTCLGFQSTEPDDAGAGGACKVFKKEA